MKLYRLIGSILPFAGISLLVLPVIAAIAQVATAQEANAGNVLGQLSAAFSGGKVVHGVQLFGSAIWYAGDEDSGSVTLTASADGASQMQLLLGASGQRNESQTGVGTSAICQWAGSDGVANFVSLNNCARPALWFLPALSLQPSLLPASLGLTDLGVGTIGSDPTAYRHLQGQLTFSGLPGSLSTSFSQQSVTDIGLDPVTFLPAVLAYTVLPDSGAATPVAIEVHYSNYQSVNGVQIPFLIQKYVNGSLQLAITVSSAQVN